MDHILQAPAESLPSIEEIRGRVLNQQSPVEFAHHFLERHLRGLCQRAELSGRLRRRPRAKVLAGNAGLDFVVAVRGYGGNEASLEGTGFLGFLRCYQLLCCGGGIPLSQKFSPRLGLPYFSFVSVHGPVRIWVTTPERFGVTHLLTTGPGSHLALLSLRARRCGHCPLLPEGLHTAEHRLLSEEEEDIYHALGIEWIAPESR